MCRGRTSLWPSPGRRCPPGSGPRSRAPDCGTSSPPRRPGAGCSWPAAACSCGIPPSPPGRAVSPPRDSTGVAGRCVRGRRRASPVRAISIPGRRVSPSSTKVLPLLLLVALRRTLDLFLRARLRSRRSRNSVAPIAKSPIIARSPSIAAAAYVANPSRQRQPGDQAGNDRQSRPQHIDGSFLPLVRRWDGPLMPTLLPPPSSPRSPHRRAASRP